MWELLATLPQRMVSGTTARRNVMLLCSLPPSGPCNMIHMQNTQNVVSVVDHLTKLQIVYFTVHHIRTQKFSVYRDLWPIYKEHLSKNCRMCSKTTIKFSKIQYPDSQYWNLVKYMQWFMACEDWLWTKVK